MIRKIIFLLASFCFLAWMAPHLSGAEPVFEWDAATGDVQGYKIYYGTSLGNYIYSKDVGNVTQYPLANLPMTEGTTYYFVVRAYNNSGESEDSNEISYTVPQVSDTTPPLSPQKLTAGGSGVMRTLNWQANTETDLSGYKVYHGNSSRNYGPSIPVGKVTSYTIDNLEEGKTYYLAVTALDSTGNESGYSNEVLHSLSAPTDTTPPMLAITEPTAENKYEASTGSVDLFGSASDNVGVSEVSWVNDRGGSGTASGTTSWSASGIQLSEGDNVLTVTATDASGNQSTDTLTVLPAINRPTHLPFCIHLWTLLIRQ
jgi:hypothetical protein